jgi:transcriptional regulator with XRE-family HTH domain
MTAAEFRAALHGARIRQIWLAARLGVSVNTISRWATGKLPVPPYVPFVLELVAQLGGAAAVVDQAEPEILVSAPMIRAGEAVLEETLAAVLPHRDVVAAVYRAMRRQEEREPL